MKVIKFGGSSLANGEQFAKVINIIIQDPERQVIVTSAPGKRTKTDTKVTDLLIELALQVRQHGTTQSILGQIIGRYQAIATYFDLPADALTPIKNELTRMMRQAYPNDEYRLAAFKAHGEMLNAQLMTLVLTSMGHPATFLDPATAGILVTSDPNDAHVLEGTYDRLAQLQPDTLLVVPGFYGITAEGEIATFSRGGSDITGAILARGLHADLYENFTDVDAIFAADPRLIDHPEPITSMTYKETRELAYAGFAVFHDEAIIPAIEAAIPINVKNTDHPDRPGTMIMPEAAVTPKRPITGVASSSRFSALYLHKYLLNKETGFTLRLLEIFYRHHVSYEHMPSGIDDLTVIFDKSQLDTATIQAICTEIQAGLQPDRLEWIDDYAIIMVVGEGMRDRIGTIDEILRPLAQQQIAVHMINQGASRISIMIGIRDADARRAVQAIYQAFFDPTHSLEVPV